MAFYLLYMYIWDVFVGFDFVRFLAFLNFKCVRLKFFRSSTVFLRTWLSGCIMCYHLIYNHFLRVIILIMPINVFNICLLPKLLFMLENFIFWLYRWKLTRSFLWWIFFLFFKNPHCNLFKDGEFFCLLKFFFLKYLPSFDTLKMAQWGNDMFSYLSHLVLMNLYVCWICKF